MVKFLLGTHETHWLGKTTLPLFISHRRLAKIKRTPPVAICDWSLDSGGFSELSMYGEWRTTPAQYAYAVNLYHKHIGRLQWAAIQDWMCEPFIIRKTGLSIRLHQQYTIDSLIELSSLAPHLPWTPVIQGFELRDYLDHVEMYAKRGINLHNYSIVGVGSICRRESTGEAEVILSQLAALGLPLHGFGFKRRGLERSKDFLISADSMAWSYEARRSKPLAGHTHKSCANCIVYATQWYNKVIASLTINKTRQLALI